MSTQLKVWILLQICFTSASAAALIALASLAGYYFHNMSLMTWGGEAQMALPTVFAISLNAIAVLSMMAVVVMKSK